MSHLSIADLSAVRAALAERHETLVKQLRQDLDESGQTQYAEVLGRASGDSSDEALAITLGDLSAARLDHEVRQLRELETAMRRMHEDDFGECVECGAAIPVARLIANPAAMRCVACQEAYEKTHHGQAHGSI
jgi:RNA polymerase-binding transcription factor DksA